jgi:hypothetical protein
MALIKNLEVFFEEKDLPYVLFEIPINGETHFIDNETVIDSISKMPIENQKQIRDKITMIDFHNGNVNDFLKHIAKFLIN